METSAGGNGCDSRREILPLPIRCGKEPRSKSVIHEAALA
jgi:hypothetical protein